MSVCVRACVSACVRVCVCVCVCVCYYWSGTGKRSVHPMYSCMFKKNNWYWFQRTGYQKVRSGCLNNDVRYSFSCSILSGIVC